MNKHTIIGITLLAASTIMILYTNTKASQPQQPLPSPIPSSNKISNIKFEFRG